MPKQKKEILKNEAIQEIYKCSRNPIYFINNYCKIQHPKRGLIQFKTYDYQDEAITNFLAYDKNIINKARQLGFSTLLAAFIVWLVLFHKDKSVLVVSTKAEVAKNLIKKVKTMLKHLPDWMYLADVTINQAYQVAFSNGSWVKSIPRSEDAGRSEGVSLLVIDEAAHIRDMDELWKGLGSVTAAGGKTIALSTPKGIGNWFYKYCKESISGENQWHYQEVFWWSNPEYAEGLRDDPGVPGGKRSPWFDAQTEGWTNIQIAQELLTSFTETGETVIDSKTIEFYEKASKEPLEKLGNDRCLWLWEYPIAMRKYLISCDVASGTAEDFSTAVVIDVVNLEEVAEYKGKMPPDVFAEFLINELGPMYNMAHIVVENNELGMVTAFALKNSDYPNVIYIDEESVKLIDKWTADFKGVSPGFRTTVKNRPIIIQKMEEILRKNEIKIYSKRMVNEFLNFIWKNGKAQARKGENDDLIMALAIGIWMRELFFRFEMTTTKDVLAMYNAVTVSKKTVESERIPGMEKPADRERARYKKIVDTQNKIRVGPDKVIDISWIYRS